MDGVMTDLESRIAALSPEKRALFESRVSKLVAARAADHAEPIRPRDRDRRTPLSFAQRREWALERFRPANNISGALRIEGDVDLDLLSRILTEITARHEVLRSTVEMAEGVPVQVVHPVTPVPVPLVDLGATDPDGQAEEVRRRCDEEVMRPFPPEQAQRIRFMLLRLAADLHIGLLTMHHASSDGWSCGIFLQETAALYQAFLTGTGTSLPAPAIQYGDFAVWQREHLDEERIASQLEYWRRTLAGMPPRLELPADRPNPARRTFAGSCLGVSLPERSTDALQRFAGGENVSISMVGVAVASVLLYRYTGQDDLVFGTAITGRVRPETERLIGCFANVLPLRVRVARTQTLREVVRQVRDVMSAAFDHQDIPFDRLIEEFAPKETSRTPLIQMMVNVLTAPGDNLLLPDQALEMPGLRITTEPMDPGPLPIDLILGVDATRKALHLQWHYSTDLFEGGTVARLAAQYEHILDQLLETPDVTVGDVDLLGVTRSAPQVAASAGPASGFVELFRAQVAAAPDAPAVVCDGAVTTFGALNRDANQLAGRLRALGVGPETPVGILLERSPRLPGAILAVLAAGGCYVPMDPRYPADQIEFMLTDAKAPVLMTTADLAPLAAGAGLPHTVLLDSPLLLDEPTDDFFSPPATTSAAYVVYTSGSTGRPKGVVVEHGSLVTFAREVAARLQLGAGDRFLQFASPGFDVLVEELFPIWLAGGAVVIPPSRAAGPGMDLAELAEKERVSVMELPAAYWHEWVRELDRTERTLPPCLRLVIVGAERVLPERLAVWQHHGVPLMHVYGITETTVSSTFFRLAPDAPPEDLRHLPIGTALPSAGLRILDPALRPVPPGAAGELYISGVSLARGYLRRPGLTAERFIADPDPGFPGARAYRTGDLVRQRADGNLEFLTRADDQINIRGYRVEPAEVESAVCRHPQVAEAVVTVHEFAPDDRRLVAYLVPRPRTRPNITDLRRFLARELPPHFVPSVFVLLLRLPVTPNGKVDRDRLPAPTDERPELEEEFALPQSPMERELADIVAAVLGTTMVGANDNFFELGGDSILAIQVAAQAQERGIQLSPLDLFEHPTVALLANVAGATSPPAAPAPPIAVRRCAGSRRGRVRPAVRGRLPARPRRPDPARRPLHPRRRRRLRSPQLPGNRGLRCRLRPLLPGNCDDCQDRRSPFATRRRDSVPQGDLRSWWWITGSAPVTPKRVSCRFLTHKRVE
jgi:amino acid adenylation domain-containing protein